MDPKQERELEAQVTQCLLQIALELEAAAAGARGAAKAIPDRESSMRNVQQLYSRLQEATHLLNRFKRTIDEAVASLNR